MILKKVNSPEDLRSLSFAELQQLCDELRNEIIDTVGANGGHLASNLGVIELTVALHYSFKIPYDALIFDVGHQAYAHKILTGRRDFFRKTLRQMSGCSGFASPDESEYDTAVSGHAGTAISFASGLALARKKDAHPGKVLALVGDASLNNGISFEALNSSGYNAENLIIILNDNQMSISKNVGALARTFNKIISGGSYNKLKEEFRSFFKRRPSLKKVHRLITRIQILLKYVFLPPGIFFQELGYRYLGPIDGHNLAELLNVMKSLQNASGPLLLHVHSSKGKGSEFASKNPAMYHGLGNFDPVTGEIKNSNEKTFTATFGAELVKLAEKNENIEAISAAMILGTGLSEFQQKFPDRCHDVGIAEEHSVIFSAGLAAGGKRPVCALYSTFAQRALDCIYHDVVLAGLPVLFVLDRAGTVEDGPTHHGIYELSFLRSLPNLPIMAPRDENELALMLRFALQLNGPAVIRYSKGAGARNKNLPLPTELTLGAAEIVQQGTGPVIWAMGAEVDTAFEVSELYEKQKEEKCLIINPRFISPFDKELAKSLKDRVMVTIEDHRCGAGLGAALSEALLGVKHNILLNYGWPNEIIEHGKIEDLRKKYKFTAKEIVRQLLVVSG